MEDKRESTGSDVMLKTGSKRELQLIFSDTEQQAQDYLTKRKIYELTNFLIAHLLADEPDEPVKYITDLLDKCILFKEDRGDPPIIFADRHIEGTFERFDELSSDKITLADYKKCMKLLGIPYYDKNPRECTSGHVDKATFTVEVKRCLTDKLAEIIGKNDNTQSQSL